MKFSSPSPIPHTPLSDALGCRVDVLDFSGLPTGTHKLLKAERALKALSHHHYPQGIAISSGNYARALSYVANQMRQSVVVAMGREATIQKDELESEWVEVVLMEDLQEAFASVVQSRLSWSQLYTSEGDLSCPVLSQAYQAFKGAPLFDGPQDITNLFSIEQLEEFRGPPSTYDVFLGERYDAIFCPNGSGELLHDLAFKTYTVSGKMRFYGISPEDHPSITGEDFNPHCFKSFVDKLVTPTYPLRWSHLENALQLQGPKVFLQFLGATEDEFRAGHALAEAVGLTVEPSGAAAVTLLIESFRQRHGLVFRDNERVLLVNTGKGHSER